MIMFLVVAWLRG